MKKLLFSVLILFIVSINLQAAHIVGGEITYEHINDDEYEFTIKIYRDCASGGADFDGAPNATTRMHVTLFKDGGNASIIRVGAPVVNRVDLAAFNPCVSLPPNLCVEIGTYKFRVNIPLDNSTYTISYQRCCRNNTIVNLFNPGDDGLTLTVDLSPAARLYEINSPVFNEVVPNVICVGVNTEIDFSVTDNNQSTRFEYEFCELLDGGSRWFVAPNPETPPPYNTVNFRNPYSYLEPIPSDPQFTINKNTGIVSGRPTRIGQYVMGVCVKQYLGNELLTIVRRDVQFNVTDCQKNISINIPNLTGDAILNCDGLDVEINPEINDPRNVVQTYEWEFTENEKDSILYQEDFSHIFQDTGIYDITFYVNRDITGCDDSIQFLYEVRYDINAEFELEIDECDEQLILVSNNSFSNNDSIIEYEWRHSDVNGIISNEEIPLIEFDGSGDKIVDLLVMDKYGCTDSLSRSIYFNDIVRTFDLMLPSERLCDNESFVINAIYEPIDLDFDIEFYLDDDTLYGQRQEILLTEPKTYPLSIKYIDKRTGCEYIREYLDTIKVGKSPVAAYDYFPKELTYFDRTISTENLSENATSFIWKVDSVDVGFSENLVYIFSDTGYFALSLLAISPDGCLDTISKIIDIPPFGKFHMPNAFTPNNDGKNEQFKGRGVPSHLENFDLRIFNREGRLIYQSEMPSEGWNGKLNNEGRLMPTGVYVWKLNYQDTRGNKYEKVGKVTLLR